MLVLWRRTRQGFSLELPDGREVFVRVLTGKGVRLGVDAPADVGIRRLDDELPYKETADGGGLLRGGDSRL